jgi:hypothetical protein
MKPRTTIIALSLIAVVMAFVLIGKFTTTSSPVTSGKVEEEELDDLPPVAPLDPERIRVSFDQAKTNDDYVFSEDTWKLGLPHPIEPRDTHLPPSGKSTLQILFGWNAAWYIYKSVCGFVLNPNEDVAYEKLDGKTRVTFHTGPVEFRTATREWTVEIDNATGKFLIPPDLPPISYEELEDITWNELTANGRIEGFREAIREVSKREGVVRDIAKIRCEEIRRVGDMAFVTWRYVEFPPHEEDGGVRHVFWVDVRTRKIVGDGYERR